MAIVNERYNAAKPVQVDPKTGKPLPASSTPARSGSPSMDPADSNSGFFGSFFAAKNKKKAAAMEAPPPMLKASGTLSERENMEVEVISKSLEPASHIIAHVVNRTHEALTTRRTTNRVVLQYNQAYDDRYGPEGHHAEPCRVSPNLVLNAGFPRSLHISRHL